MSKTDIADTEAVGFDPADNLSDQTSPHRIRLDNQQGLLAIQFLPSRREIRHSIIVWFRTAKSILDG
jgi:hypothetical protein